MHPPLTDKRLVCREFIKALEECHSEWWGARFTGECNNAKHELNLCLRRERVDRAARNREISRERAELTGRVWEKLERDD